VVVAEVPALPGSAHDETDPPEGTEASDTPTPEQLAVASRVVALWSADDKADSNWSSSVWSALLRKSLFALESGRDERAVPTAISLLVREPHLTPQVCGYLVAVGRDQPDLVHEVLDELCDRDIVSIWQSLWIAYLAGSVSGGRQRRKHVSWLREQLESPHDSVSAQAALALARRRLLSVRPASRAYDRAPEAHRTTAALALAAAQGVSRGDLVQSDQIEGWLANWARKQSWGLPSATPVKRVISRHP